MIKTYKVTDKIFTIKEHYFSEYANIFIFKGDDFDIIFDIGVGIIDIKKHIQKVSNNFKIIPTHIHFDHIGGLKYFAKDDIFMPQDMIKTTLQKELLGLNFLQESFLNHQIKFIKKQELKSIVKNYKNDFAIPMFTTYKQRTIKNSNFSFEIMPAPGHTKEGIMFWENNKKILISGDSLYQGEPLFCFKNSSKKEMQHTLSKIKKLNPKIIFPGHNQILKRPEIRKTIHLWEQKIRFSQNLKKKLKNN